MTSRKNRKMSHYTVQYLDQSRNHQEICEYAENSWEAKLYAIEDGPYLHDHPNKIDAIMLEGSLFSSEI